MRIELFDGTTTVGLEVDATDADLIVSVLVDGAEVAGIDPAAGTVGTWPDGQTWVVAHRFAAASSGPSAPGSTGQSR